MVPLPKLRTWRPSANSSSGVTAFVIPTDIKSAWEGIGSKGAADHAAWNDRLSGNAKAQDFKDRMDGKIPEAVNAKIKSYIEATLQNAPKWRRALHL